MRTNESILQELNITERLSTICMERALTFFGHIMRSPKHSLEKLILLGQVEGKCAKGRTPARWSDVIRNAVGGSSHRATHAAYNRLQWRHVIRGRDPHHYEEVGIIRNYNNIKY